MKWVICCWQGSGFMLEGRVFEIII